MAAIKHVPRRERIKVLLIALCIQTLLIVNTAGAHAHGRNSVVGGFYHGKYLLRLVAMEQIVGFRVDGCGSGETGRHLSQCLT